MAAAEGDEGLLVDDADLLAGHAFAEPLLDLRVLEVEEVPRVVPDEALLLHGLAPAADLAVGLEHEVVRVFPVGQRGRGGQAGDSGADDEGTDGLHGGAGA